MEWWWVLVIINFIIALLLVAAGGFYLFKKIFVELEGIMAAKQPTKRLSRFQPELSDILENDEAIDQTLV